MDPDAPGVPDEVVMLRPGTEPWSMLVRECDVLFSSSLLATVVMAPVRFTFF